MDFLGLRNLSIIDDTLTAVKRVYNRTIRLNQIPLDDETTLALFRKGETSGVFQFESAGIRNVLRKLGQLALKILLLSMPCIVLVRCKILMFSSAGKKAWNKLVIQSLVSPPFWKIRTELLFTKSRLCKLLRKWQASL